MRTQATARYIRVPACRGGAVAVKPSVTTGAAALTTLPFKERAAARLIEKVLRSAIANA